MTDHVSKARSHVLPSRLPAAPGQWLGLLGGGQLGRMFAMAAQSLGFKVMVVDPGHDSPAGSVADGHLQADYLDAAALTSLANTCVAVTTEFENVPAQALAQLADHCAVSPAASAVAVAQNRLQEKAYAQRCGVPAAPHAPVLSMADINDTLLPLLPGILKTARMGYDGKGQVRVSTLDELKTAFVDLKHVECVLEKRLNLAKEVSVIVARDWLGNAVTYPLAENEHSHGILATTIVPARVPEDLAQRARAAAINIAQQLDYVGVLCVELFVLDDGQLVVNEMAPRPHNSGHYSIDACVASQFEQQARILAGLPLGSTRQHSPAVMINILGDIWFEQGSSQPREPDWSKVLAHPQAKLHLYGKSDARPGRKMGHITCVAETLEEALAVASTLRTSLGIE